MRAFSWCPWIPGTFKLDSILSLFKCGILKINFLSQESCCDDYIEQLIPTSMPIAKIKMKVFGSSGVGKTALIDSLKAGYFSGLFRRSKKSSQSNR